jgi:chromosome segregation ATPase
MAIPSVVQGTIETEDGKVFELDSPKGAAWLETVGSFRFEPSGDSKACTVRREPSGYWYGCRKIAGKVRKKYIGKTSEINTAKLEEAAEALEVPPVLRVNKVTEVAQKVAQDTQVAEKVAEVTQDSFTALKLEVADLRKTVEALQEALPGKLEAGDSAELPKVDSQIAERLQNDLSNLKAENKALRQELADARTDYAKLLESSAAVKASREKEIAELRSQLDQERADRGEVETQLADREKQIEELRSELSELKQKSAAASKYLPEAAEILNQLKAHRKKSSATLADVEKILDILEGT